VTSAMFVGVSDSQLELERIAAVFSVAEGCSLDTVGDSALAPLSALAKRYKGV
jgi:hypothetical protein